MEKDGSALEYASDELREDREIVLVAVKKAGGLALRYASDELKGDREIVRAAAVADEHAEYGPCNRCDGRGQWDLVDGGCGATYGRDTCRLCEGSGVILGSKLKFTSEKAQLRALLNYDVNLRHACDKAFEKFDANSDGKLELPEVEALVLDLAKRYRLEKLWRDGYYFRETMAQWIEKIRSEDTKYGPMQREELPGLYKAVVTELLPFASPG